MRNKNVKKAMAFAQVNTKMKLTEVAKKFGVSVASLYAARNYAKKKAAPKKLPGVIPYAEAVKKVIAEDLVNHPAHYKAGGIETIDFIEAKKLNYNLGNVVKYITRSDLKGNRKQDLEKALWYLKRELGAK